MNQSEALNSKKEIALNQHVVCVSGKGVATFTRCYY